MLLFEQQQFEFLLQSAVERFVERSEQRFQGAERALEQWRQDPKMLSKWLSGFCDAVFEDFLLNNVDGACFVLRAMSKHKVAQAAEEVPVGAAETGNVESHLCELAKRLFGRLLYRKAMETLEMHSSYQSTSIEGESRVY